jgi:hypothetical protein
MPSYCLDKNSFKMEQHDFAFSWNIEGTTEKVLQFIMPLNSIYNNNLDLTEQKCIFEHKREVQTIKNLLIVVIFVVIFFW